MDDITPSLIDRLCENPVEFELETFPLSSVQCRNLEKMICLVAGNLDPVEPDLIRGLYDAILAWRNELPPSALKTSGLGKEADLLQPFLRQGSFDPFDFLVRDLPRLLDGAVLTDQSVHFFAMAIEQFSLVTETYVNAATAHAAHVFNSRMSGPPLPLMQAATAWAETLPLNSHELTGLDQEAQGILSQSKRAASFPQGERGFLAALSGILLGIDFDEWSVRNSASFRERLEAAVHRLEVKAFDQADSSPEAERFLKNYLARTLDRFSRKIGHETLTQYLEEVHK